MKWVPDKTGRFQQCPHYLPEELDTECEQLIASFLQKRYGKVEFPIKTEDLTVFIEEKADLDSFADLSGEEGDVEGMTEFLPRKRPTVGIAGSLNQPYLENRLRTTLTHEYGHVHYHRFMFDLESSPVELLFPHDRHPGNKCKRDTMVNAAETDWMEWQAGYVCGAILMPSSPLIETVRKFRIDNRIAHSNITVDSEDGQKLIAVVSGVFQPQKMLLGFGF